ncbi:AAA family ATPase [Bradyrhizobium sp. CB1650]|uniref:adenylate/guanylate cyclase domain-containing protein n=1 Tax=Bradyrhizobium sp. CB1650 TaxID=3039153 RepID=UPI0024348461|nr:adenylate/guanylate cyclase domain-containing protein [Bradyrhizobium sp. CB1650]WGD53206.1 AAA family ATPase [Bradyrhizobium sp. CB1650]
MQQVADWLEKLGMSEYAQRFAENRIDFSVLRELTDQDLKDLGVVIGDRRKMLRAIADIDGIEKNAPAAPARATAAQRRTPIASEPIPTATPPPISAEASGERRYVTVMFCDLVGSTSISAQLDAEEWRDLVGGYLDAACTAVTEMGGHVSKKLGDGVMVLFGYPVAQENDAERAARAALLVQRALAEVNRKNTEAGKPALNARIGIETGAVVIDAAGEIYGDAPNVAARVQALAEPGTIVVTARVQHQVAGLFVVEGRGSHELKGVPEAVTLYQLVRASGGGRRAGQRHLAPLVGREEEIAMLMRRWERARRGDGQLVMIVGEPGLGKSRLIEEFHPRLREVPHTWVEWSCSQLLQNTPLHPIADWGRQRFGGADIPAERRLADLENTLALVKLDPAENVSLLAPLLDIPLPQDRAPTLEPEELRRRQLTALTNWVMAGARTQPVVLALEDVHWADPTTLELLRGIAERGALAPLLVLITARPEFRPPWGMRSHHSTISLAPLDRLQVRQMVGELASRCALSREVVDGVTERTGGVPLFVEEMTRLLLESGGRGIQAIPPTLQQSLTARLDRLGPAREVAQIGAVIGRDFSYTLLRAVTAMEDRPLQIALERLAEADILLVQGLPPDANYRFKHVLIQDAAYENLLKSRRQVLHRRVGEVLRDDFAAIAAVEPEVLAHHFTEAGRSDAAVEYWQRAGDLAMVRSGHAEAIHHFSVALDILRKLGEKPDRVAKELELCVKLGPALMMVKGPGSPDVEAIYSRAVALEAGEENSARFKALWGLYYHSMSSGRLRAATAHADELLGLAQRLGADDLVLEGHHAKWATSLWCGNLAAAGDHSQKGISQYDCTRHHALAFAFSGHDPGVCARAAGAINLALLGFPQKAMKLGGEAVTLARSLSHPYSLALAMWFCAIVLQVGRQRQSCRDLASELIELSQEHDFPMMRGAGTFFLGWATADSAELEHGIASMEQGLALFSAVRQVTRPYMLAVLASAKADLGRPDEGLELLKDALALTAVSGEVWWQAEMHSLRGRLLAARGQHDESEACFRCAIEVSRGQSAKTLELRAATSLGRLWSDRGRNAEARDLLAPIYGWFTEGFGTPDLKEAKILLDALSR